MSEYRLEMCDVVKTFPGVKALNHAQLKLKPKEIETRGFDWIRKEAGEL